MITINDLSDEMLGMIASELFNTHTESVSINKLAALSTVNAIYGTCPYSDDELPEEGVEIPQCVKVEDILVDMSVFQTMRTSKRLRNAVVFGWAIQRRHILPNTTTMSISSPNQLIPEVLQYEAEAWRKCATTVNNFFQERVVELAISHLNPYYAKVRSRVLQSHCPLVWLKTPGTEEGEQGWDEELFEEISLPDQLAELRLELECADDHEIFNCGKCDIPIVLFEGGECPYHAPSLSINETESSGTTQKEDVDMLDWEEEGLESIIGLEAIDGLAGIEEPQDEEVDLDVQLFSYDSDFFGLGDCIRWGMSDNCSDDENSIFSSANGVPYYVANEK